MSDKPTVQKTIDTEIQRIHDRDGLVKASVVLNESKQKSAPLHGMFEWRNHVAAEEYRLEQARKIIRRARIIDGGVPSQLVHVPHRPVHHSDDCDGGAYATREGYYKTASVIMQNVDEYESAYEAATKALAAAQSRVHQLEAAARIAAKPNDDLARISVALKALDTAEAALRH